MSMLLDNLMLHDNDTVSKTLYRLPDVLDITSENPIIQFDAGKKDSYLFYVENPIQEEIGYREDLKIFVIKANPFTTKYNLEVGQKYDELNTIDGDTVYFDIDSIIDDDTAFKVGNKSYSSLSDFLKANDQYTLIMRLIGLNCAEVCHYKEVPVKTECQEDYIESVAFKTAVDNPKRYLLQTLERDPNQTLRFFKTPDGWCEIIGEGFHKDNDTSITFFKIVSSNETLGQKQDYIDEGLACKQTMIHLLNEATDIRLILDHQSLNRKPSSYTTPYDKLEYLTDEGVLTPAFAYINALWEDFFSGSHYPYRGYNIPGQDVYGRSLGEIYVKIYVEELGTQAWVNAAKYILYHHDKFTEPAPVYTSNPTETYENNFMSPAFKLNTYDKRYKDIIDGFTHATSLLIDERNQWYSEITGLEVDYLKEHTVILGDCVLTVPPMNIRSVTETNHTKIPLLRSKGSIVKSLPRSQKILEMDIYFNDSDGINGAPREFTGKNGTVHTYYMNGLRSLIAQFKLTPFLPIENNYINDSLFVEAVTLVNMNVQTVPNYPRCLKATLTLAEFNYSIFMPELPDDGVYNGFAQSIHYPAMRWYYQRLLANGEAIKYLDFNSEAYITKAYGARTSLVPMDFKNSRAHFYIPDKGQLQTRLELMMDPKPIVTQEALTEEMLVGAKKLGPLINKINHINEQDAIFEALAQVFKRSYYDVSSPVLASSSFTEEPHKMSINVPALTLGAYPTDYDVTNKKAIHITKSSNKMLYKTRMECYPKENKIVIPNMLSIFTNPLDMFAPRVAIDKHLERCRNAEAVVNSYLGIFGAAEINVLGKQDNQLEIQFVIPLPREVAPSSYEERLLIQKLSTSLELTEEDANSTFGHTSSGQFSVIIKGLMQNKGYYENELIHYFELEPSTFKIDTSCFGCVALLYLYDAASDEENTSLGDAVEEAFIDEKRDVVLNEAMGLKFVKYDTGDLLIEQISINYSNTFSNMTLNMIDGKAFQYTGAQDINLQFTLITNSQFTVSALTHLPEISAEYARSYRRVLNCWPLRFDCEFTKLFGVMEVLIENVQTETIPNQPGYSRVTVTLSSVDRTVRQKESLSRIDTETTNAGYINYGNKGRAEVKTYFDLKHSLAKAELYPDLELPTIEELRDAGFELYRNKEIDINKAQRVYVDPDFYFVYGQALACEIFRDNFLQAFERETAYDITDTEGAYTEYVMRKNAEGKNVEEHTDKNNLAPAQRKFWHESYELETKYNYKDMSKEVYKALNVTEKNVFKLGQTLAELGTSFWNMTGEIKMPFAETSIELMPETVTSTYNTKKKELLEAIDSFLNVSIEDNLRGSFASLFPINPGTSYERQIGMFENHCKTIANEFIQIKPVEALMFFLSEKDMLLFSKKEGSLIADEDRRASVTQVFAEKLEGILLAYADAYTGESYYTNQTIAVASVITGNKDYNWKAKQWKNVDKKNPIPYARVSTEGSIYATSIGDALENGISFGPFNISTYKGASLLDIYSDKTLFNNIDYFLDPYYLQLQCDQKAKLLKEHKEKLLSSTVYGAVAFLREMLTLYRHYVVTGKVFSLYETARMEAVQAYRDNWRGGSNSTTPNIWDKENIGAAKDGIAALQADIINDYVKVLKGLSKAYLGTQEERQVIVTEILRLKEKQIVAIAILDLNGSFGDIATSVIASGDRVNNYPAKSIKLLQSEFEGLYNKAKNDPTVSDETVSRYKYLYEICVNYKTVDQVISFARELQELLVNFESENSFSQNFAEETMEQVYKDEVKMFPGRFIGMACALIEPQTICPLIEQKNSDALTTLFIDASRPDITHENSTLRKFLYALDGRKVLSLANIGDIPLTLEAEYRNYITEKVLIERSNNPHDYLRDSFYDMIHYDKRGRMLRAFPTYYMFFIDEGREIGLWKLHDNFYSSSAIAEIEITKSRKIAADTAHIVLSNLFNSYTQDDRDFIYDLDDPQYEKSLKYKIEDAFNALFSPRTYFNQEEAQRLNTPEPLTARLTPGTRIHIRMGYGANASELPIVFNGQIAEISNGEVCEIVAQGDGVELLNPIQDIQDAADIQHQQDFKVKRFFETWLTNGATPKTILASILTSRGYWKDKVIEDITNGYMKARNPYGLTHFGDPLYTAIFANSECIQNLFEVNSGTVYALTEEQKKDYIGLEKYYATDQTPSISIDVLGKTTWDVGHICASVAPDYRFAVVPFELRSSLFLGKGRDYYAYEYELQNNVEAHNHYVRERRKPFEQYHYYTSYSDIIANNIVANGMNVKTNAIGLYQSTQGFGKVKPKETTRLFVDADIYPEYQRSTVIDTQLWAQGFPVLGNGFFLGINADTDDDVDDAVPGAAEIAWRMTASGLKQSMKDMYEGELVVMGDPSVKPHDRMLLTDLYEEMQGGAWVEAVVHSFNAQTGFTTSIYADCINEIDDRFEQQNAMLSSSACSTAFGAYGLSVAFNQLLFRKNMKRINNGIMELILKGGLMTEANKGKVYTLFKAFNLPIEQEDIRFLETSIKTANNFDWLHFGNAAKTGWQMAWKDKQSIKTAVSQATKALFARDGHALVNVILTPFDTLNDTLKILKDLKTAKDVSKLLIKNADALEKASGQSIKDVLDSSAGDLLSKEQYSEIINHLDDYDQELSKAIEQTFTLNDKFKGSIDDLAKYVLNSEVDDATKDAARMLETFVSDSQIKNAKQLKQLGQSIDSCADICTDTKILKAIGETMDNINDFSRITNVAKDVRKIIPNIDNALALIGATTGPVGIIASVAYTALEMAISYTMGAYATEAIERYLQNLQVMRIYPLSKENKVMVAGITGHKGLVIGSPTENTQGAWTEFVTGLFGAKEPSNFITGAIQFFFASDKAKIIARRYRTENNLPDVIGSGYDLAELQARFDKNFNQRSSKLANKSPLLSLNLNRYNDLKEAQKHFKDYTARSYKGKTGLDKMTQQSFIPIEKHEGLATYMKMGILKLYHDLNPDDQIFTRCNDDLVEMNVFFEADSKINAPMLRQDTLNILDKLICTYVSLQELDKPSIDLKSRLEKDELQLTSATIVDLESYEGTGFVFRIASQNTKALEVACAELKREMNKNKHVIDHFECGSDQMICLGIPVPPQDTGIRSELK